jgi:hypothetical protein
VLDELLPLIEGLQSQGAVVLLKWDGERTENRCTVVVTRPSSGYTFRRDSDDISASLREAFSDFGTKNQN